MGENIKEQLALAQARAERLKKARAETELLLEQKSRELYEANQKLETAQAKLEDDIKRATHELHVSNQRLQTALNEKSTFIGQMSHEVRTPLNAIIGLSEILLRSKLDDAQRDYIDTINNGAKSLIVLLNDMLDITRIEAGRVDINPQPTNTQRLHQNIIAMFEMQAKERKLSLDLRIHNSVPAMIRIDKGRYQQIINNLISNALKNTESGGVSVLVNYSANTISDELGILSVKVVDTGVGIPANQLKRIFNAYEQIGRPDQGVGLGLAICQQLSELMMGKIHCQSKVGRGSIFELSLPVEQLNQPDHESAQATSSDISALEPLHILIAEDNPINQKVISAQLAQLGQKADIVDNGAEAIKKLEHKEYDVVILDILMPIMDGEETIMAIRNASQNISRHYCIALTASTYQDQRERLLALGFDDFLSKPLSLSELSTALKEVPRNLWLTLDSPSINKVKPQDPIGLDASTTGFDFDYLKTQFGDAHKSIFSQIAPTFLSHAYEDLERLKAGINEGSIDKIEKISHSMKGAASSIGLSDLANLLLKIEKSPNNSSIHLLMDRIEKLMQDLKPVIEQELKQIGLS